MGRNVGKKCINCSFPFRDHYRFLIATGFPSGTLLPRPLQGLFLSLSLSKGSHFEKKMSLRLHVFPKHASLPLTPLSFLRFCVGGGRSRRTAVALAASAASPCRPQPPLSSLSLSSLSLLSRLSLSTVWPRSIILVRSEPSSVGPRQRPSHSQRKRKGATPPQDRG